MYLLLGRCSRGGSRLRREEELQAAGCEQVRRSVERGLGSRARAAESGAACSTATTSAKTGARTHATATATSCSGTTEGRASAGAQAGAASGSDTAAIQQRE